MRRLSAVLVCVVLLGVGACSVKEKDPPTATTEPDGDTQSLTTFETPPPWPLADRQADRMDAAGLPQLTSEGKVVHFHSHLDVFHNGTAVQVPDNIGIDFEKQRISPLHTHYETGIIHVEAEKDEPVTLGMFLTEWGVRIDAECIGDICGADKVALYVNGEKVDGPARDFVITKDLQIALVLGTPPATIPATYDCAANPQDSCDKIPQPTR